jgi:hypothetical protein
MAEEEHKPEATQTAEEEQMPEAAEMMSGMPPMLAYTIRAGFNPGQVPFVRIGQGQTSQALWPATARDDSYWIVIMDANKPTAKLQEWVIPGQNNTAIPSELDHYITNPGYLFAVATQSLANSHVPQGAFYDYLIAHGAGRELQKLEQVSAKTQTGYGLFATLSYVLTGQCGPKIAVAYEVASFTAPALLLMSLMPTPEGPPYSICDSYTFITR